MTDLRTHESQLDAFLERQQLATWNRHRSSDELANFISRRFAEVEDAA